MTRAAIYARYSSDKQNDRSIEDQITLCRALAIREGFTVTATYDDRAQSGASTIGRDGLQRLYADARRGAFDVVVTESLDRLSRDQEDLAGLDKRLRFLGIGIYTANDGSVGQVHIGVRGMLGALFLKDVADKTRRGLAGVVDSGRHAGGRAYGYRPVPGRAGELTIDEAEAAIVRRIFADYLAGNSPRAIACALNSENVAGPRSSWNASTITGSRERQNGILRNRLYEGTIVWNRQAFIKDPDTGRRVSRPNAADQHRTVPAPHLRIVPEAAWAAVQARLADRSYETAGYHRRPAYLLSGLLKCGHCGSGYVTSGAGRVGCSRHREAGTCDNARTLRRAEIEDRVIAAVRDNLLDAEFAAEYVRVFHEEMRELQRGERQARAAADKKLADATAAIDRLVRAIAEGLIEDAEARPRMAELRAAKAGAEAALESIADAGNIIELRPGMVDRYRQRIENIHTALRSDDLRERQETIADFRALVTSVEISSAGPRRPAAIAVHGTIAALVDRAAAQTKTPIPGDRYGGDLVAGTRNGRSPQLPTIRLVA